MTYRVLLELACSKGAMTQLTHALEHCFQGEYRPQALRQKCIVKHWPCQCYQSSAMAGSCSHHTASYCMGAHGCTRYSPVQYMQTGYQGHAALCVPFGIF